MEEQPVFEETQTLRWIAPLMLLAVAAAAIGISQVERKTTADWIGFAFLPVLAALVLWGFGRMKTVVTPTELRFGYPIWKKRVPVSQVRVGEIKPVKLWYGVGIHWVGDRWVYNAHLGRAVEIDTGRRKYLIGSREPERLQAALLQASAQRATV